jgi:hypothetical protein
VRDVGRGLLEISHNTLALVGLAVVAVLVFAGPRRHCAAASRWRLEWLQTATRRATSLGDLLGPLAEPDAVSAPPPPTRSS